MTKPTTIDGYNEQVTRDCERVLVTILRHLGPWKESVFLVGGMTPRYLVRDRPPVVPAHAGTLDLDIVIDVVILEDTEAYRTLEQNLRKIKFKNATNEKGQNLNWRWWITLFLPLDHEQSHGRSRGSQNAENRDRDDQFDQRQAALIFAARSD